MSISMGLIAGYAPLGVAALVATVASRLSTRREPATAGGSAGFATWLERGPEPRPLAPWSRPQPAVAVLPTASVPALPQQGRPTLVRAVDLNERVREMQAAAARDAAGIIVIAFTAARDARVRIDAMQLDRMLLHLMRNARDAMPRGGLLTLRTDDVAVLPGQVGRAPFAARPGRYVLLELSDTGAGVPAHARCELNESPASIGSDSVADSSLGVVSAIVRQNAGYMWVGDADGGGARIVIHLPVAREGVRA